MCFEGVVVRINRAAVGIDRRCKRPERLQGRLSGAGTGTGTGTGTGNREWTWKPGLEEGYGDPCPALSAEAPKMEGQEGGVESCRFQGSRVLCLSHPGLAWRQQLIDSCNSTAVGRFGSFHSKQRAASNRRELDSGHTAPLAPAHPHTRQPTPFSGQPLAHQLRCGGRGPILGEMQI